MPGEPKVKLLIVGLGAQGRRHARVATNTGSRWSFADLDRAARKGLIHANKQVKVQDDLKGLKLRFPTRLAGEALKALGATAIGMPIPQVPESLAQKVIDGCVQLHGGYGYMMEYRVARDYVDARIQTIFGGTTEIMKEIIGRDLGL